MSEYQGKKFQEFLSKNKISKVTAAEMLGISRSALYDYFKTTNMSRETVQRILTTFEKSESEIFGANATKKANARSIGEIEEQYDLDGNNKFTELSPGRWRMKVDLVPNQARAGWMAGFEDPTHIEELPKHELTVTKHHKGRYMAFEVDGDSMTDGTIESVPDGCVITGREIKRDLWKSKFHVHKYPNWIFAHKTEGVLVKRIKSQNLATGDIILEGINPNKEIFPDIHINLDDVLQVYNVVKRELD